LGELRLGRDYAPTFWNHTNYDPFGTNGVGSHNNMMMAAKTTGSQPTAAVNNSGLANFARNDNSIGYFLPAMGAISGQLQFAMPEDTGGKGQYFGGRLVYQQGGLSLAGQAATTQVGAKTAEHSSGVAGSYDFTSFKLMAQWNRYTLLDDNVVPNTTKSIPNNRLTNYLLGVTVPVNQQLTLKASYNSTSANLVSVVGTNIKNAKAVDGKQVALGLTYDLSKRTALYTTYSRINNGQDGTYVVSNSGLPIAASKSSSGYDLGIRHSF
jgi:predicted porin